MNQIRKNTENEVDIISMSFKIEPIVIILHIIAALVGAGVSVGSVFLLKSSKDTFSLGLAFIVIGAIVFLCNLLAPVLKVIGAKKSIITVSNRRLYGKYGPYLIKKTFSYRLDEIDNVEVGEYLGAHSLVINFQDGKGPMSSPQVRYGNASNFMVGRGVFKIRSVENYREVYDKLTEMLLALKSNVDLKTDIEMAKVDVEKRKAEAIEKVATSVATGASVKEEKKDDYIDEIVRLKKLLDDGIITKEEFDQEKKEILDHNHK